MALILTAGLCPAGDFEAAGGGGTLFYDDDRQVTFGKAGASYSGSRADGGVNIVGVNSNAPEFTAGILGARGFTKTGLGAAELTAAAGVITSPRIDFKLGGNDAAVSGMNGFYGAAAVGIVIGGDVEIRPSLAFARMTFWDGDFYHFYGKPIVPMAVRFGLSAEYKNTHGAGFTFGMFDIDVVNNDGVRLLRSDNRSAGVRYRYARTSTPSQRTSRSRYDFYAAAGVNYAEIAAAGALTAENQQYALFPYLFYNVNGRADAVIGWALASLDIEGRRLKHGLKVGVGNIFGGRAVANAHYQYRKFYGDEEAAEEMAYIDLSQTGAAFAAYSVETGGLAVLNRVVLHFETQKILAYPWGADKIADTKPPRAAANWELLRTILFSGLSCRVRAEF